MKYPMTIAAALLLAQAPSVQAQTCNITSSSVTSTVPYDPFALGNNDTQGSVSFSCTRPKGNPRFPTTFWVGPAGTNGARSMVNGASSLTYTSYTNYTGCSTPWQGTTGLLVTNTAPAPTDNNTLSTPVLSGTFCFRIASGQTAAVAGSYLGSETFQIRSTDSTGYLWASGVLSLGTSIGGGCSFTQSPTMLAFSYTSFQAGDSTPVSDFIFRCTNNMNYSLTLDSPTGPATATGTALGLNYSLAVRGTPSGVGTGSGVTRYIDGTMSGGQSGACAALPNCTANPSHVLYINY